MVAEKTSGCVYALVRTIKKKALTTLLRNCEINRVICGDALQVLRDFDSNFVDCVVTSPPYWGLRDYGIEKQLGLEPRFEDYISKLCAIFDEVQRVLKAEGTCFVVMGDTYAGSGGAGGDWQRGRKAKEPKWRQGIPTAPSKCLCQIPSRFAIEMCNRDTMDIWELNGGFIRCNSKDITEDANAIQRPRGRKALPARVCQEMAVKTCPAISEASAGLGGSEPRESKAIQQKILLGEPRKGDFESDAGSPQISLSEKDGCSDNLWRKSSEVRLLWGNENPIFDHRPYQWKDGGTSRGIEEIRFHLSMAKEHELSKRFQSFVHELQLCHREIWLLPPSGGRNLCLRKRDIPIELLPLFRLKKEERWRLRNELIWHKPNCLPSSVKDRFTVDFEKVFFFVKQKRYYFEQQLEDYAPASDVRYRRALLAGRSYNTKEPYKKNTPYSSDGLVVGGHSEGRNKRCVWSIPTQPSSEPHFAMFPEELIAPMIRAGCPEGGIVLDPFAGMNTTGIVARKLNRNFIGIELNPEYRERARRRIEEKMGIFAIEMVSGSGNC